MMDVKWAERKLWSAVEPNTVGSLERCSEGSAEESKQNKQTNTPIRKRSMQQTRNTRYTGARCECHPRARTRTHVRARTMQVNHVVTRDAQFWALAADAADNKKVKVTGFLIYKVAHCVLGRASVAVQDLHIEALLGELQDMQHITGHTHHDSWSTRPTPPFLAHAHACQSKYLANQLDLISFPNVCCFEVIWEVVCKQGMASNMEVRRQSQITAIDPVPSRPRNNEKKGTKTTSQHTFLSVFCRVHHSDSILLAGKAYGSQERVVRSV